MYAELVCRSNFSFLQGAAHPEELVAVAKTQGLSALALTDRDGLYGVVKAHLAAKSAGLPFIVGAELTLTDGPPVVVYVQDKGGYANLCRLLSQSRLSHPKGEAGLPWRALAEKSEGLLALLPSPSDSPCVPALAEAFSGRFYVGLSRHLCAGDAAKEGKAVSLAKGLDVPLCAHNDVHTHHRRRQRLQDVLTAIRNKTTVEKAGTLLFPNAERTLKPPREMAQLFHHHPDAVGRTLEVADLCRFSLDELKYEFSEEYLPEGHTPQSYLTELVEKGLRFRYPSGVPADVRKQISHELSLIGTLDFAGYFLTLWDVVHYAKRNGILCQGRGSAANSAVCFALEITAIDPVRMGLLFERFISMERKEPPDIDVDFEHERREEVIQYVYEKYGRHRAGMVCEVVCFRDKLAAREVGKALGLSLDQVDRLSRALSGWGGNAVTPELLVEAGLSPHDFSVQKTAELSAELEGFPRHLSIHVGGFVVTKGPLLDLVPIENASMPGRTVVQWDKDDLSAVDILKVDLLALGMLTVISKCFALLKTHEGVDLSLATIPPEDPRVYDMLCEADAVGVFQLESRAQMNMLPRLRPRTFYDLVVQVAIIRPGPIIGDMVHPFLRRRDGREPVSYPSEAVRGILEKTLGVPLFQEQAMRLAMEAAGFTPNDADQLRRILSHKRAEELMIPFQDRFIDGCVSRGYPREFAENCFKQFRGFSHYGFPESHAASFALIAYASAYLKCYFPWAFTCALLNSQPMGFYAAHTLVADAKRHGTEVLPVDVNHSDWDCTLEGRTLRLGLRMVKGLRLDTGERLMKARKGGFLSVADVATRARLPRHELARLALSDAFRSLGLSRREVLWEIQALGPLDEEDLFFGLPMDDTKVELPPLSLAEGVSQDYESTGLSLDKHPLELLRPALSGMGALTSEALTRARPGRSVAVGGMVICRQRPPTAKGICFLSLEDETGISNVIVMPDLFEPFRKEIVGSIFLGVEGVLERTGKVTNVKAKRLFRLGLEGRRELFRPVGFG